MRFWISLGFLLWLAATIVFRLWGGPLIDPGQPLIWLSFIVIVPLILLTLRALFRARKLSSPERPRAAMLVAIPGMLLDLFSVAFHDLVFPGLPQAHLHLFFVWLLWAYSLILLGGLLGQNEGQPQS